MANYRASLFITVNIRVKTITPTARILYSCRSTYRTEIEYVSNESQKIVKYYTQGTGILSNFNPGIFLLTPNDLFQYSGLPDLPQNESCSLSFRRFDGAHNSGK